MTEANLNEVQSNFNARQVEVTSMLDKIFLLLSALLSVLLVLEGMYVLL